MINPIKRLALIFSDGSMGVCPEGSVLEKVLAEAAEEDPHETDADLFVRVAEVEISIAIDHGAPRAKDLPTKCPTCGRSHEAVGAAS